MWWIVRYLDNYYDPRTTSVTQWTKGEVTYQDFTWYLLFKRHYREDIRDTIQRWFSSLLGRESFKGDIGRARTQRREIDDAINKCLKKQYITSRSSLTVLAPLTSEIRLSVNTQGREFLKPLKFLNTLMSEYGYITSLLTGGVVVGIMGKFLHFLSSSNSFHF